jgi:hypothetical protein
MIHVKSPRHWRHAEAYSLKCHKCKREIEIPVHLVNKSIGRCKACDCELIILWGQPLQ